MNRRSFLACTAGAPASVCGLPPDAVPVLREIREHNALLFDFVLKRSLASRSVRFPRGVFETQPFFFDPT